jgi:phosphoribosylformylglycinamidine cyclo-ligase
VGVLDEEELLGPHRVREGDVLVGLASSGLHANGYSLVRAALLERRDLNDVPPGLDRPLVDELLEPCAIYAPEVVALSRAGLVRAAAHVTGGGILENLPRAIPPELGAEVDRGSWPEPPIFGLVRADTGASENDLFATFNMGIGMVLVVSPEVAGEVAGRTSHAALPIGRVVAGGGVRLV